MLKDKYANKGFKFDIGDRIITKATHTPGVILKKFNDIIQGKRFITYTIQCRDSSSIMLVSQDNLELDKDYQPIKK